MITGIENIKTVVWKLDGFIGNLILQNESNVYKICGEYDPDNDFLNVCHKAKQEIEYLAINKNDTVLRSYYDKMKLSIDKLEKWELTELEERFKINQINITLIEYKTVFDELKKHLHIEVFNSKYPSSKAFGEQYSSLLYRFLKGAPHKTEKDFIDFCLLEIDIIIKRLKAVFEDPSLYFSNSSAFKNAPPFFINSIKNTQKRYIHECNSIVRFLKEKDKGSSQPNQVEEKQNESFAFKNNFDGIPPQDVYNHFKAGLVDKKHIDLETLETFLKQAFNDYKEGEPLKGKLKMNNTTNSLNFIIRVFHKYYSKQVSKHGKKSKYVKLLTDNFIDFDYQKTHDNFRS